VARVNSVFRFKAMADRLRSVNHRLKMLSLTDELTGLSNMRAFNIDYQKLIKGCRKGEHGLGLIMLDLDHFKTINDNANHLVGSFVIGEIGRLIAHSGVLGKKAVAARYGGDEYIVCMPTDNVAVVWDIAERIQDLIMRSVFKKEQYTIKLTSSFGMCWVDPGFEGKSDDLIKGADVMLYRSKRHGRNMVSGMVLRYPVDFNHIGRPHLVDRDSCRDHHNISRVHNA
jgi:diguanylate cyclase (GGDEF)-like protein